MNWSVRAGPATALPRVQGERPRMCGSRIPRRLSSPLAVALPILANPATNSFDGRSISGVSIIGFPSLHNPCLSGDAITYPSGRQSALLGEWDVDKHGERPCIHREIRHVMLNEVKHLHDASMMPQ